MNTDKMKAIYHTKFRKNINRNKSYIQQLLNKAQEEYKNHPAFNPYARENGVTSQDRLELKALNELVQLYQLQIDMKKGTQEVKYTSC